MRTILLIRVSDPREEGLSPDAQNQRAFNYCDQRGLKAADEDTFIFTESAWKRERKQFNQIMKLVKDSKEPIALVCDRIDRLLRNVKDLDMLIHLCQMGRLELHFVSDGKTLTKDSPSGDFTTFAILAVLAKDHSDRISERVKLNFKVAWERGRWMHKAPFGYTNTVIKDENDPNDKGRKAITENPRTKDALISEFELKVQGWELRAISRHLKEKYNIKRPISSIDRDLHNPFYGGFIEAGGQSHPHSYPLIVPPELFEKVQNLARRKYKVSKNYLFIGLVTCDLCGSTVTSYKSTKYPDKIYLKCTRRIDPACPNPPLSEKEAIIQIAKRLKDFILDEKQIKEITDIMDRLDTGDRDIIEREIREADRQLKKVTKEMNDYAVSSKDLGLPQEVIKEEIDRLKNEWYGCNSRKSKLEEKLNSTSRAASAKEVIELARQAYLIFIKSSSIAEKRQLLQKLVEPLKLRDKQLIIRFVPKYKKLFRTQNVSLAAPRGVEPLLPH